MNKVWIIGLIITTSLLAGEFINEKTCMSCHGSDWGKKALGKSKVVADMNVTEITDSLIGYKDGTYGGKLKGLMKGQVQRYTDEELTIFSEKLATDLNNSKGL